MVSVQGNELEVSLRARSAARRRFGLGAEGGSETLTALVFLAPSALLLAVFAHYPLFISAYTSLTDSEMGVQSARFVGFANYARLFRDPRFLTILTNTSVYAASVVTIGMLLGLGLALLIHRQVAAAGIFRAVLFAPYVTSAAIAAILWAWIFDPQLGFVNMVLRAALLPTPAWLSSKEWAMSVIIALAVWRQTGYCMVIFLAGLQNVPTVLHEAARIDGASALRSFWHVTLPLLSPTALFLAVSGLIISAQAFDIVAIMTQGGPLDSTNLLALYLYQQAFTSFKLGVASSVAMVLFSVVMLMTVLQLAISRMWVHYE